VYHTSMKQRAKRLMYRKLSRADGSILQFVVWELPEPLHGSGHRYKYRFYFGRDGKALVRYDNERGKGDHRHYGNKEEPYTFRGLDTLLQDFLRDVAQFE
jgi:Family of unknown function (DUF6516)